MGRLLSLFKYTIGYLAAKLDSCRLYYQSQRSCKGIQTDGKFSLGGQVEVVYPSHIFIGNGTYVNGGLLFASENAHIYIGHNCLISYHVFLRTHSHAYTDAQTLIQAQGSIEKDIRIEDDCWIGYGAMVMGGVTVKRGCVIAANAVVTHDTEEYGVYAGVPARLVSKRR